jgi:hypothetical protein
MIIERLIEGIAKVGAKVFFNKEEKNSKKLNLNQIGSGDILELMLRRLVYEGDYNKAENMLFQNINENNSQEMYPVAINFYNLLLEKTDKELEEKGFTREEIYQGLEDIKNIARKQV